MTARLCVMPFTSGHFRSYRPPPCRQQREVRLPPLGGGAHAQLTRRLPSAEDTLRAQSPHVSGVAEFRLFADLFPHMAEVLKPALNESDYCLFIGGGIHLELRHFAVLIHGTIVAISPKLALARV